MLRLVALLVTAALAAGACNPATEQAARDPKATLLAAIEHLEQRDAATMHLTLEADTASLQALAAQEGEKLSDEDVQKYLDSSITLSARRGDEPADSQLEMLVNILGEDIIALRSVDRTLYARADVPRLAELFGFHMRAVEKLEAQARRAGITFLGPAIAEEWIALSGMEDVAARLGLATPTPGASDRLFGDLSRVLQRDATVTFEGSDDTGDRLSLRASLRDVYRELVMSAVARTGVPSAGLPPVEALPRATVRVETWVADGELTQIELDLRQLAEWPVGRVPPDAERIALRVTLEEFDDEIEAPADAVTVDLQQILGGLFGMFMGSQSSSAEAAIQGDAFPCEALENEPRRVRLQFKDECPELFRDG